MMRFVLLLCMHIPQASVYAGAEKIVTSRTEVYDVTWLLFTMLQDESHARFPANLRWVVGGTIPFIRR